MITVKLIISAAMISLLAGCGMLRHEHRPDITGIWTGTGTITNGSDTRSWDTTLTLGRDTLLTLTYDMNGKKITLTGRYTADLSRDPATIDISDFGFPKSESPYCCLAIAEFPATAKMNVYGVIGPCGKISRPLKFVRTPTKHNQVHLLLTRKK